MIRQLESHTGCKYVDVVTHFEQNNLNKSFITPSGIVTIDGNNTKNDTTTADIALWVVNGASSDKGASSSSELRSLIQGGALNPKELLLIVVINQMDAVGWDEGIFRELAENFQLDIKTKIPVVPLSAQRGDNILEPPRDMSWAKKSKTLLQVIG